MIFTVLVLVQVQTVNLSISIEAEEMFKNIHKNLTLAGVLLLCSAASQAATVNGFANGGFEIATGNVAANWNNAAAGYTISHYSHSGENAMRLSSPQISAAIGLQNSLEQGGLPPLIAGDHPLFSFWVTGDQGTTGDLNYALRYLDSVGNILADSGAQHIGDLISWDYWTEITYDLGVVPDGATAAFLEIVQAIGPIGTINGTEFLRGTVIVDDVYLGVQAPVVVPIPAAAWLFGSALLGLVAVARRKKAQRTSVH